MILKEEQRYGRNKSTAIDHSYIDSGEYRNKFDSITDSKYLNKLLYKIAKKMLNHRSGTKLEDMYWIDAENECVICSKTDEIEEETIRHTDSIDKAITKCDLVIAMHTHPKSFPPSAEDFNCFLKFNYAYGIVICHDGTIYLYTTKREISKELWESYVQDELNEDGSNQKEAQLSALHKFEANGDIEVWEV